MISTKFETERATMIKFILQGQSDLEHGFSAGAFILRSKSGFPYSLRAFSFAHKKIITVLFPHVMV